MTRFKRILIVLCFTPLSLLRAADSVVLENEKLARTLSVDGGVLKTVRIENRLAHKTLTPGPGRCEEFRLRLSTSVDSTEPDTLLTAADFTVTSLTGDANGALAELRDDKHGLRLRVHYTLEVGKAYGHKFLEITSDKAQTLELVDIESIAAADAFAPATTEERMWVQRTFLPALGEPIYTKDSATYWGVEFPASWNRAEESAIRCGYQRGIDLRPSESYTTYKAVFGVADDPAFIKDALLQYIEEVRRAPARLKIQYNSWFDFKASVTQQSVLESIKKLHNELVVKRGCRPLDTYVIDDGWQNSRPARSPLADWSTGIFQVNEKTFETDLVPLRRDIESLGSKMGLWVSPACIFGAQANVDVLEQKGFDVLVGGRNAKSGQIKKAMSMTGPRYMELYEKRMMELVDMGSFYFKLDGIFGDVVNHFFETKAGRGAPVVSHLIPADMTANDPRLDDPKFDETKRYYITAATERLMTIFDRIHSKNPDVRIMCHNGATISPWWLMHLDVLSMVNMQDGASGTSRTEQLCYRDGLYHQMTAVDKLQVPLSSFFNHEPAKNATRFGDATPEAFRDYFFMALSRGSASVEFYFVVKDLKPGDFDVVADGIKWLDHVAPAFTRARMHGGSPIGPVDGKPNFKKIDIATAAEVYGYTGWTRTQGYVSIHNPSAKSQNYSFHLDRAFGLESNSGPFELSYAHGKDKGLKKSWGYGETVTLELQPREILVLNFDVKTPAGEIKK